MSLSFSIIGVKTQPIPEEEIIFKSGIDVYLDPIFSIITSSILPSAETTGLTCPFFPEMTETSGVLLKLRTSLVPYPEPLSDKCTEVTSPLNIG